MLMSGNRVPIYSRAEQPRKDAPHSRDSVWDKNVRYLHGKMSTGACIIWYVCYIYMHSPSPKPSLDGGI